MLFRLVSLGFIYLCPVTVLAHWTYVISKFVFDIFFAKLFRHFSHDFCDSFVLIFLEFVGLWKQPYVAASH